MSLLMHDVRTPIATLEALLARFRDLRIGLLGDLFLDRYLEIDATLEETSIETDLPAHQVVRVRNAAGALGTVISNLAALGAARLTPLTVIGRDGHGDDLMRALADAPVELDGVVRMDDVLTPTYTKPLRFEHGQATELSRLDIRDRRPRPQRAIQRIGDLLAARFCDVDGWVVLDQVPEPGLGVVCGEMRERLESLIADHPEIPVLIDSRTQLASFRAGVLKGNRAELAQAAGCDERAEIETLLRRTAARTGGAVFCTDGARGAACVSADGQAHLVATRAAEGPLDVVGCGDAFSSAALMTLAAGEDMVAAARMGNLAASITVRKIGETGVATPNELRAANAAPA